MAQQSAPRASPRPAAKPAARSPAHSLTRPLTRPALPRPHCPTADVQVLSALAQHKAASAAKFAQLQTVLQDLQGPCVHP